MCAIQSINSSSVKYDSAKVILHADLEVNSDLYDSSQAYRTLVSEVAQLLNQGSDSKSVLKDLKQIAFNKFADTNFAEHGFSKN